MEDGLLQIRDIVGLPLDGRVFVLGSCESASGADLVGEGVLSIAAANAAAERKAIRAWRPAATWAGHVVLGDGGIVLGPGGASRGTDAWLWALALAAAARTVAWW